MGKGGEKSQSNGPTDANANEVLVNGRVYDITNMKHPGGSVIKFYSSTGIDASQAFNSFHLRSKKAQIMLQSLPSRPKDVKLAKEELPGQTELLADFDALQIKLQEMGFFKPSISHVVYRVSEILIMHIIGGYLLLNGSSMLLKAVGIAVLGLASGRCGWLMHEGGHYSLTGNISTDKMLQVIIYGVGCGMSGSWWRNQHNKHHSMPQKLGHDVDLETLPLVAFTNKVFRKLGFSQKLWLALQAPLFPLVICELVALGWQFFLHPRHILRVKNSYEALALLTRYALWTALITAKFGLYNSALIYLAYNWVGATYIFLNFAVSHTHLPVVPKDDTKVDWVRYAAIHTMNVKAGPLKWVDWWMSYLNYQVEHHLFPSMPQFRHPQTSIHVQALFKKHGLVYDQRSYTEAMRVTFANLHKVGVDAFYG